MLMAIGGLHLENPCGSLLFYKRDFDVTHLHPSWVFLASVTPKTKIAIFI